MGEYRATYIGEGVVAVDGVGVFQKHTTAQVPEVVARQLHGTRGWEVAGPGLVAPAPAPPLPRPTPPRPAPPARPAPKPSPSGGRPTRRGKAKQKR